MHDALQVNLESDSIDGIYNTLKDCAMISKYAGGIGMHIHHVRSKNSVIRGTNGRSTGIVPMLRVFNSTARWARYHFLAASVLFKNCPSKFVNFSICSLFDFVHFSILFIWSFFPGT